MNENFSLDNIKINFVNEDDSVLESLYPNMSQLGKLLGEGISDLRLDVFLAKILQDHPKFSFSRTKIQNLIKNGNIMVNHKYVNSNIKINANCEISIALPKTREYSVVKRNIQLEIIYEDNYLALINKPSGLTVHPGAGNDDNTLVNALLYQFGSSLSSYNLTDRPGIIHRLDKDTSGIMMIAKSDESHAKLANLFKARQIQKTYLALVEGYPQSKTGEINLSIARHKTKRKIMCVDSEGREAITFFKLLKHSNTFSLLELLPKTGRTHQLRVHLAYLNLPIAGDLVYNNKASGKAQFRCDYGLNGHLLHAFSLEFIHPYTLQKLKFEAPLPAYFKAAMKTLIDFKLS